jgi:hypothetical protein
MALEKEELFEVENGFFVTDNEGNEGPILTGGANLPFGLNFPVNTFYIQTVGNDIKTWRKFGNDPQEWTEKEDLTSTDIIDYDLRIPSGTLKTYFGNELHGEVFVDGELYVE